MSTTLLEPHAVLETPARTAPTRASARATTNAADARPTTEPRETGGADLLEEPDPYRAVLCCGRVPLRP
jgi:hypothetical protein